MLVIFDFRVVMCLLFCQENVCACAFFFHQHTIGIKVLDFSGLWLHCGRALRSGVVLQAGLEVSGCL